MPRRSPWSSRTMSGRCRPVQAPRPTTPWPATVSACTPATGAGTGSRRPAADWGGEGPAVLLLHGLASNARIWDGVGPRLVGAGLRVVALDLRGHGASDQPGSGYDFAIVGRDLA